jgi:hypothetical protein
MELLGVDLILNFKPDHNQNLGGSKIGFLLLRVQQHQSPKSSHLTLAAFEKT